MKKIPKVVRDYVYKRDKGRCRWCQKFVPYEEAHIHHLYHRHAYIPEELEVPPTKGNMHPYNLILLCSACHAKVHFRHEIRREARKYFIRVNQAMEYKYPFPKELVKWLKENEVRR